MSRELARRFVRRCVQSAEARSAARDSRIEFRLGRQAAYGPRKGSNPPLAIKYIVRIPDFQPETRTRAKRKEGIHVEFPAARTRIPRVPEEAGKGSIARVAAIRSGSEIGNGAFVGGPRLRLPQLACAERRSRTATSRRSRVVFRDPHRGRHREASWITLEVFDSLAIAARVARLWEVDYVGAGWVPLREYRGLRRVNGESCCVRAFDLPTCAPPSQGALRRSRWAQPSASGCPVAMTRGLCPPHRSQRVGDGLSVPPRTAKSVPSVASTISLE